MRTAYVKSEDLKTWRLRIVECELCSQYNSAWSIYYTYMLTCKCISLSSCGIRRQWNGFRLLHLFIRVSTSNSKFITTFAKKIGIKRTKWKAKKKNEMFPKNHKNDLQCMHENTNEIAKYEHKQRCFLFRLFYVCVLFSFNKWTFKQIFQRWRFHFSLPPFKRIE